MGILPSHIPHTESRDAAEHIVRTLRSAGHVAYFAGGCVRDELLGLVPTDYDVATDAIPTRIAELFPRTAQVGASFGVMLVKIGRVVVEVATFRADGEYSDKRRPDSVRFSDPAEDARRRDFTVNALFLDPIARQADPARGIIDLVDGLPDLAARVLRAVGDPNARLNEDHLRALRAARLAAKLGFTIDPATAHAIRVHAADLSGVSRERIGEEVRRMLGHPTRARAASLLRELALEVPALQLDATPIDAPFPHLAAINPADDMAVYPLALAAWVLDLGLTDDPTTRLRTALCLSNDDTTWLRAILSHHATLLGPWSAATVAQQKRWAASRGFLEALELLRATNPPAADAIRARVDHLAQTFGGLAPTPLIDGDQLVALGLRPGPAFKVILDQVFDAQLEGHVRDLAGAQDLALRLAKPPAT